ncbi:cytochrome c [Rhodohalobacter sp.]|uniref:c-type cytochrome n=1 Tax=Rhodohalobacter sp. TaxID=1974210 RepID=UPI002ACEDE56|nr:cytochrome c [Rhodohalobacter sp.]MDZ7757266.1 cytochrome c [Rhodohalobacter sp.]
MAWLISLEPAMDDDELADLSLGARTYVQYCTACHRSDRSGSPESGYPSLRNLDGRLDRDVVENVIENGRNMMPAFGSQLSEDEVEALVAFLYGEEEAAEGADRETGETQPGEIPKFLTKFPGIHDF